MVGELPIARDGRTLANTSHVDNTEIPWFTPAASLGRLLVPMAIRCDDQVGAINEYDAPVRFVAQRPLGA